MSVTPMRMMSSPLGISQQYHSNIPVHNPNIPSYNPSNHLSEGGITPNLMNSQSVQTLSQSEMSSFKVVNPLDGSTSFITPKVIVGAAQRIRGDTLDHEREATIANQQLARIILAERDLNLRLEYEARNRNTGKAVTGYAILKFYALSHCHVVNVLTEVCVLLFETWNIFRRRQFVQ